jgi:hypothetical protein
MRSWPNRGTIPEFAWRNREKPWNTSITIAGGPTEIRTRYFPNKILERYHCVNLLSTFCCSDYHYGPKRGEFLKNSLFWDVTLGRLILISWRRRQEIHPKRMTLHGVTSQKAVMFMNPNLTTGNFLNSCVPSARGRHGSNWPSLRLRHTPGRKVPRVQWDGDFGSHRVLKMEPSNFLMITSLCGYDAPAKTRYKYWLLADYYRALILQQHHSKSSVSQCLGITPRRNVCVLEVRLHSRVIKLYHVNIYIFSE